jgi:hypothetical protein
MWPTYSSGVPILPADWVRVYVPQIGLWHHGIVRHVYGVVGGVAVSIIHNAKDDGVTVSDWYDFANGNDVQLHQRSGPECAAAILARADSRFGHSYSLLGQNCEHFASEAFTGVARSESVVALGIIALLVAGVAYSNSATTVT